ncbi:MAG: DUF4097 family beta strand repeat protein [Clostridia bacterium]|nr:DUF4097 family beta strand repeat protein [Clostridia bacterium]
MKPTSVIFLIVSILLASVGFLLCMTATSLATEQGIGLFTQIGDDDDNYIATETFTEEELKKIVVKVSNVRVNIIGGADESRIELVNFMNNSYQIQAGRSTLQISDNSGITGIIDIDNFKINFHGFRDYLHYLFDYIAGRPQKDQVLNVYLTDEADLVNFNITVGDGDITISNMTTDCDYKIVIDSGVVDINNVNTDSSIQIESTESSNIEINNVYTDEIRIVSPESECFINISETTFSRAMYVEAKSGDIVYDRVEEDFAGLDVKFEALGNTISVFGENYSDSYVEFNAPVDGEENPDQNPDTDPEPTPDTDPVPEDTTSPEEETTAPEGGEEGDDTTAEEEETTKPEDIGDLEEEENNSSITIPANSLTIIIADGKIEVK